MGKLAVPHVSHFGLALGPVTCSLAGIHNERHNSKVAVAVVGPVLGTGVGDAATRASAGVREGY
jgi:hypothetical protein